MTVQSRKLWFSLAGFLCSAAVAISSAFYFPPRFEREPYATVGRVLARQVSKTLKSGGEIVAIARDTAAFGQPANDITLQAFSDELKKLQLPSPRIVRLQIDPLRQSEVPPGDLFELMRKTSANGIIVSIMGPPLLSPEQISRLGPTHCKVIAFCPGAMLNSSSLNALFEVGILEAAIVTRAPGRPSGRPVAKDFEHLYEVVVRPSDSTFTSPKAAAAP